MRTIEQAFAKARRRFPAIAVGVLDHGDVEITVLGTVAEANPLSLCWEIGSITKVFTGILLAHMSLTGEVGLADPIGTHLPDDVAARLPDRQPTLIELSMHTAGLPRVPLSMLRAVRRSSDPYGQLTTEDVFAYLGRMTRRPRRTRSRYSNYGAGLLGHLLERASDTAYRELLQERILAPLGMEATDVGTCGESAVLVEGFRKSKPAPPWTFGALGAAGSLRSTVGDLLTFARAVIEPPQGTLGDALDLARERHLRTRLGGMGLGWMHRAAPGSPTTSIWHNGGTYGGSSFIAIDPVAGRAVVALGNAGAGLSSPLDGASWRVFDALAG